jgi:NitT/TauT family transport system permease protein
MPVDTDEQGSRELEGLDTLELLSTPRASLARRAWSATWPKVMAVALVVLVWQTAVWLEWRPDYALSPPEDVWPVLRDYITDGTLTDALRITMRRAATGFFLALVIGVGLGMAVARVRILRSAFGSLITGLQTMPSVAWFPLAFLMFRGGEGAIMFVVVLGAAPSIANGLINGVDQVPPILQRAGRVLGARGLAMWRHVTLPAALPSFVGGLKQGWAFSWRSLMAGELLVIIPGEPSIGFLLQTNRDLNNSEGLIAVMIVILAIGIVVDSLFFGTAERAIRRRWGLAT